MLPRLTPVLAVLGGVWMLFLFFNAADVTYLGPDQSDDRVALLILVATATTLLVVTQRTRSRRAQVAS